MPCRSDYMEPNAAERYTRETAQLIGYANRQTAIVTPAWVHRAAEDTYGNPERSDELTRMLCETLSGMGEADQARVVYDGRKPEARRLADWWEKHQKADADRLARENAKPVSITWDRPKRDRLRRAYSNAVAQDKGEFEFEDNQFVTNYAKYLLEFLDTNLGPTVANTDEEDSF